MNIVYTECHLVNGTSASASTELWKEQPNRIPALYCTLIIMKCYALYDYCQCCLYKKGIPQLIKNTLKLSHFFIVII